MYTQRESRSDLIRLIWHAYSDEDGTTLDAATEYWGIAFTRRPDGEFIATIAAPNTAARHLEWTAGEEYWGAELEAHVVWPGLAKANLLGQLIDLPARDGWCEIAGVRITVPTHDTLEVFIERLAAQGILTGDPAVRSALIGEHPAYSQRTMQRRFRDVTGLGAKQIAQIRRARDAYSLLQQGISPAEVASQLGYADQAHLTRSLRVLAGRTPREILTDGP